MRHTCLLHLLEPLVNPRENPLGVAEAAQVAVANRLAPAALPVNHCTQTVSHSTQSKSITPHRHQSMSSASKQRTQHKTHALSATHATMGHVLSATHSTYDALRPHDASYGRMHDFTNTLQPVCTLQ